MIPIYFPHTYIPESILAVVHTCFSPVAVYQPSRGEIPSVLREWHEAERIELHAPPDGDEDRLAPVLSDFRQWAALHGGQRQSSLDYFKSRMGRVPFFDETSVAQIRADIRGRGIPSEPDAGDRFFVARVFLRIAQEMDMEAESLAIDLRRHDEFENKLYRDLAGNGSPLQQPTNPIAVNTGTQRNYMIPERLLAWWLLVEGTAEQTAANSSGIFVTTSRTALEHSVEMTDQVRKIFTMVEGPTVGNSSEALLSWRRDLLDRLLQLVGSDQASQAVDNMEWPVAPATSETAPRVKLTLFLIPGTSPAALFRKTAGGQPDAPVNDHAMAPGPQNTVIALIETRPS